MERGEAQRSQINHDLWRTVCQDTGIPLVLEGWEGQQCTEVLQTLSDQALKHLKHTLPKEHHESAEHNDDDGEHSPNEDGDEPQPRGSAGPIVSFNYKIDSNNSAFQNLKEFAKFSLLHCGVQQPLCAKSTSQAIADLKEEYRQLERANRHYSNYLKIVEAAEQLQLLYKPETQISPEEKLVSLKERIAVRRKEIESVKQLRRRVRTSTLTVKEKMSKLRSCYKRTVSKLRERETARHRGSEIQQSLCTKIRVAQVKAYHLKRTNIFNDSFFIWHLGPFATINGNRLGRLPTSAGPQNQVDYPEINAAWGCAALLLHLIGAYHASKTPKGQERFAFKEYSIRPRGSNSTLMHKPKNKVKELFYTGGWTIFSKRNYMDAMHGFLSCVQDLYLHIQSADPSARVPYEIHDDCIGGISIKNLGDLPSWTEACKYTLTNLKWLVAWTAKT